MWKVDAFKRVWLVALGCAAAEGVPVADVKQGYESIALYKDVLVNMPTLNTDTIGPREELKPEGAKKDKERERRRDPTTVTSHLSKNNTCLQKNLLQTNINRFRGH